MARLLEYQGKSILAAHGLAVPRGGPARSADEARRVAQSLGVPTVIKIQAWTTGRAAIGGVAFANSPDEAAAAAERMLSMTVGQFRVESVLVEEKIDIARELFVSLTIDDKSRAPVILFAGSGGSGIEERAGETSRLPCSVSTGPDAGAVSDAVERASVARENAPGIVEAVRKVFSIARAVDARNVEINPLVITRDGRIMAADCRVTIDDYAVARHPELGIEIAREFDHPPTPLEKVAYGVEQSDHRGTFYFAQLATVAAPGSRGLVGFHGAGGGGSMMSMDALTAEGFTIANFTDTSGNPSAAKVYRAARIILAQPGLVGYFGSGSGVASQEQFWSAYGLAKAFWELNLDIPAVIRLGGNTEDRAVDILSSLRGQIPSTVEGYRKSDPPATIAARFRELVEGHRSPGAESAGTWRPRPPRCPRFVGSPSAASFAVKGGTCWIDPAAWKTRAAAIASRSSGLLRDDGGSPSLRVTAGEFAAKDSEMIACEVECRRDGIPGVHVVLDIPGLNECVLEGSR